jgi:hypothetical protein
MPLKGETMINLTDQYKSLPTIDIKDLHRSDSGDSLISAVAPEQTPPIVSTVNRIETFIEAIKKKIYIISTVFKTRSIRNFIKSYEKHFSWEGF